MTTTTLVPVIHALQDLLLPKKHRIESALPHHLLGHICAALFKEKSSLSIPRNFVTGYLGMMVWVQRSDKISCQEISQPVPDSGYDWKVTSTTPNVGPAPPIPPP